MASYGSLPQDVNLANVGARPVAHSGSLRDTPSGTVPSPSSGSNLFVSGLPSVVDDRMLHNLFEPYGTIESCKVMLDVTTGASRGYGFVLFALPDAATKAIAELNRTTVKFGAVSCSLQVALAQHDGRVASAESTSIFVRNIPTSVDETALESFFSQFGPVNGVEVSVIAATPFLRKAAIDFETVSAARAAIDATHSKMPFEGSSVPVLSKFADCSETKRLRRAKKQQPAPGAAPSNQQAPPMSSSFPRGGPLAANSLPAYTTPQKSVSSLPTPTPSMLTGSFPHGFVMQGGSVGDSLPAGSFVHAPQQPTTFAIGPPVASLLMPLNPPTIINRVFYTGILGVTADGLYLPLQPEAVRQLVPTAAVVNLASMHPQPFVSQPPAAAGAPSAAVET